jgi:uncharacterized integral membrane protein
MKPKVIALLVLVVIALIIVLQNFHVVSFRIFFWAVDMSLIILTLLTLIIGFLAGYLTAKLTSPLAKR